MLTGAKRKEQHELPSLSACCPLVSILVACGVLDLGGPNRRTRLVQHDAAECVSVSIQRCLLVKESDQGDFQFLDDGIEGFAYQWGSVYTLEVDEHRVSNPPADGSSLRLVLRKPLSQTSVAPETEFDLVLTAGGGRVQEVAPDRYRFFDRAEFSCPAGSACTELRGIIAAGPQVGSRRKGNGSADAEGPRRQAPAHTAGLGLRSQILPITSVTVANRLGGAAIRRDRQISLPFVLSALGVSILSGARVPPLELCERDFRRGLSTAHCSLLTCIQESRQCPTTPKSTAYPAKASSPR